MHRLPQLAVLGSALLATACGSRAPVSELSIENMLLFSVDTLRADLLGCYGNGDASTPTIDAFAAEGLRFDRAYVQATMTNPSLTSIFTGLLPPEHGVHDQTSGFASGIVPVPVVAADEGLATGSFVANMCQLQGAPGTIWHDGWDERFCGMQDDPANYSDQYLWDEAVVSAGLDWIARQEGRWLAWIHLMDPHAEHRPPPHLWDYEASPVKSKFDQYAYFNALEEAQEMPDDEVRERLWDLYAAEVRGADEQFARALAAIAARDDAERTAVIFFADHGEELFETIPRSGHGMAMTEGVLRVPLIVRAAGVEAGSVTLPVEAQQIAPTILDLLSLDMPYPFNGPSLLFEKPSRGHALSYGNQVTTSVRGLSSRFWLRTTNKPYVREFAPWKTAAPWFEQRESLARYAEATPSNPEWLDPAAEANRKTRNRLARAIKTRHAALTLFGEGHRVDDPELIERLRRAGYVDPLELGTDG